MEECEMRETFSAMEGRGETHEKLRSQNLKDEDQLVDIIVRHIGK
jgi:hypothetical protein